MSAYLVLLRVEVAAFHSGLNRLVSVALFVASRRLGVTQHPALRSPDFPLAVSHASDCLANSAAILAQFRGPSLISGTQRRMNDQTVLFQRRST